MKHTASPRSEASTQSFAAFDTQSKNFRSKLSGGNVSKCSGKSKASLPREEEIDAKSWKLSEKLGKEYDRTFNNNKTRSQNFVLNQTGSLNTLIISTEKDDNKSLMKFEKHRILRTRDF